MNSKYINLILAISTIFVMLYCFILEKSFPPIFIYSMGLYVFADSLNQYYMKKNLEKIILELTNNNKEKKK